jgi:hypothetical protein
MMSIDHELGELKAYVQTLQGDVSEIKKDVKALTAAHNAVKGGKAVVIAIATVLGTVGGAVAQPIFAWFQK